VTAVKNVIIWGNHSSTQYPDVSHGTVEGKPIKEALADSAEWLEGEFVTTVQQRGAAIIKVRGGLGFCAAAAAHGGAASGPGARRRQLKQQQQQQ
jgi:malate dehydrogenase